MFQRIVTTTCFALLGTGAAQGTIMGASGPNSSAGTAAAIIGAPADLLDDAVINTGMQGFDEAQGVVTGMAYGIDGGSIDAGTAVNSHMIFLNNRGRSLLTHQDVQWLFDGRIIGVMSNGNGSYEAASSAGLGAPNTNYTMNFGGSGPAAPFTARGFEVSDSYSVAGDLLTVFMRVTEPGDWIRVLTAPAAIPVPATLLLSLAGLAILGRTARRRGDPDGLG